MDACLNESDVGIEEGGEYRVPRMKEGREGSVTEENTHMPAGVAGQTSDYLMPAQVISNRSNSVALGVPFLASTRRAAPETWSRGTRLPFLRSRTTQIPDTDMLHYLY